MTTDLLSPTHPFIDDGEGECITCTQRARHAVHGWEDPTRIAVHFVTPGNESGCAVCGVKHLGLRITSDRSEVTCQECTQGLRYWDESLARAAANADPADEPGDEAHPTPSPPSHAPARKDWGPVLTADKVEEICEHIEKALPMDWACHLCDVNPETLTMGRKKHADLNARVEKARAKGGASLVGTLHADTMNGRNVTRSTFLLERLYPKQFHLPMVITGPGGAPVMSDASEKEPPVKRRWMLEFMRENGRWPRPDEEPEEDKG